VDARTKAALKRLHAIRRAALLELSRLEDSAVAEVVRTATGLTRQVERLLATNQTARAEQLLGSIDLLLSEVTIRQERFLLATNDSILDVSLSMKAEGLASFGIVTPRRILALSQQFNADFRPDLRSDAYNRWIRRIPKESLSPESALRDALAEAVSTGKSSKDVVADFLARSKFDKEFKTAGQFLRSDVAFKNLPVIQQKIAPLFRALRVMRTEMGRLDNVAGITFDQAAGLDYFINLGIGDDRQSEICADATLQDPMTLAEWGASEWEIAPRHPYCRCAMYGVPDYVTSNMSATALDLAGVLNVEMVEA